MSNVHLWEEEIWIVVVFMNSTLGSIPTAKLLQLASTKLYM